MDVRRGVGLAIQVGDGLGLKQYELPGDVDVIGHVGGTAGYSSFVGYLPERQAKISMVINIRDDPANHLPGHRAARRRSSD